MSRGLFHDEIVRCSRSSRHLRTQEYHPRWDVRNGCGQAARYRQASPFKLPKRQIYPVPEFGVDQRPNAKANTDYAARLTSVDSAERAKCTFVFVTPRQWPGKGMWEKSKNAAGEWKAVRAFDASDLEQWLEQSVPAQIWLAEQLALPVSGYETLEQAWRRWVNASAPHYLTPEVFEPSIAAHRDTLKAWLGKASDRPF